MAGKAFNESDPTPLQGLPIPTSTGSTQSAAGDGPATEITEQEIAERAYSIYVTRGSRDGESEANWAQAQQELYAERSDSRRLK